MSLSHVPFSSISAIDIDALVSSHAPEGRDIDFKRDYSLAGDGEKKELARDVSAMANAIGGDIIYGIDENAGRAAAVTGVVVESEDSERRRIESILAHGIAPRIPGLQVRVVGAGDGKQVLVLRVPQSIAAPHMVAYGLDSRFYVRVAGQRLPMDVHQVKEAFMATEQITNRLRALRHERIEWIRTQEVGARIRTPHLVVMHLFPVSSLRPGQNFSLDELRPANWEGALAPLTTGGQGYSSFINLDGPRVSTRAGATEHGYVQVFRYGALESVDALTIPGGNDRVIPAAYEENVREAVDRQLRYLRGLGFAGECAFGLSLLDVQGYRIMALNQQTRIGVPIDRQSLILPEAMLDLSSMVTERDARMRNVFDLVWNACGMAQSPNFDPKTGAWR